jgi:NAD(P)-dependent dehydrogenase (short-subunit alcohol dehydrogenase family)
MKIDLSGKVALVTASTAGIGLPSPKAWRPAAQDHH